jgi:hypothetical protein
MRRLLACVALVLAFAAPAFAAADITFVSSTVDTTNAASYTFTDHAIGTAADDRCVVVAMHSGISAASAFTITSITIGGNAASVVYQQDADGTGLTRLAAIASLLVTSGTTATIVVTPSTTANRMRVAVYTLTGTDDCTTLADSDFSEAADPSVALDVPANGSAVGACTDGVSGSATWTGLTETYDSADEAAAMISTGGAADFAALQTGLTMTCDYTSSGDSGEIGIFVSFGPAAAAGTTPARIIGGGVF